MEDEYKPPELADWLAHGIGNNANTVHTTKNGMLFVYVRRHIADREVLMVANVHTLSGFGASRHLYRELLKDKPAIAENILEPKLEALLGRWGWPHTYYDLGGTPTMINQAFADRFPHYAEVGSAAQAIMKYRNFDFQ